MLKVIIIGKADTWIEAPMEGETWGVNDLVTRRPVKLTFNMHDLDACLVNKSTSWALEKTIEEVNRLNIPVVTQKKYKYLPTSIPFPFDKILFKYFTNTVAYMVAYAIYKKATSIDIYGVKCALESEYTYERPCIEFWLGLAVGLGINVAVKGESGLLTSPEEGMYGVDWGTGRITELQ